MKSKKGISLIVLVITIIVMIILAAAIILSLSNSGIISKANKAKTDSDISNAKELVELAHSEWLLMTVDEQTENGGSFVSYVTDKLEKSGYDPDKYILSEEGSIEVCVAKIGDTKYSTLKAAVDASSKDGETTITLVSNIQVATTVTVYTNREIILDLAGYSIYGNKVSCIENKGYLKIIDSSSAKSGKIEAVSDKRKYKVEYDLNKDGAINELDSDIITANYNKDSSDDNWDELKKYDINNDNILNVSDMTYIVEAYNVAYAVRNNSELQIEGISKDNLKGEPTAIYNKSGTVTGY